MAVRHEASHRVDGALVGLAVVALAGVFFFVVKVGGEAYRDHRAKPPPLHSWSNERVVNELGEHDQRVPDCAGMSPGLTGYVWVDEGDQRIVIICKE